MDVARAQKSGSIRSRPLCCQQSTGKEREYRVGRGKEWGGGGAGANGYKTDKESFGMKSYFVL